MPCLRNKGALGRNKNLLRERVFSYMEGVIINRQSPFFSARWIYPLVRSLISFREWKQCIPPTHYFLNFIHKMSVFCRKMLKKVDVVYLFRRFLAIISLFVFFIFACKVTLFLCNFQRKGGENVMGEKKKVQCSDGALHFNIEL